MLAIYKKELKSYLTSMVGYVFIAFILLMTGIYFMAYNLTYGHPMFSYTLSSITFSFLIITPVLTMKVLAEERKQKTDQLLLTAPVSIGRIVMGKYLAMLSVFSIPVFIMCFYPLILSMYGGVSFAVNYSAILAFFFLGAAYMAIGLFVSSVTESQVIAAVLTLGVLLVTNLMAGIESLISQSASSSFLAFTFLLAVGCFIIYGMIRNLAVACFIAVVGEIAIVILYITRSSLFEGAIQKLLGVFDVPGRFSNFAEGIFDVTGLIYYISIIVIFVFLTIQSIQKRRWS